MRPIVLLCMLASCRAPSLGSFDEVDQGASTSSTSSSSGDQPAEVLGVGNKNETAEAIALHPSGDIAVCGFAPSPMLDDDVMVRLVRPELPGQTWALDYQPKAEHMFWERARDCAFIGDKLALVGEVHGGERARQRVVRSRAVAKAARAVPS